MGVQYIIGSKDMFYSRAGFWCFRLSMGEARRDKDMVSLFRFYIYVEYALQSVGRCFSRAWFWDRRRCTGYFIPQQRVVEWVVASGKWEYVVRMW